MGGIHAHLTAVVNLKSKYRQGCTENQTLTRRKVYTECGFFCSLPKVKQATGSQIQVTHPRGGMVWASLLGRIPMPPWVSLCTPRNRQWEGCPHTCGGEREGVLRAPRQLPAHPRMSLPHPSSLLSGDIPLVSEEEPVLSYELTVAPTQTSTS